MFFFKRRVKEDKLKVYVTLLKRKDSEIEELKRQNELLLKTALRQAQTTNEWKEHAQKLEKENIKLKETLEKRKRKNK